MRRRRTVAKSALASEIMTDDLYRLALATLQRHLEAAGVRYSLDDGDFTFNGHRLGLSVTFEGFVQQEKRVIAPVDVQLHVDDDDGNRFRVGTLGVGANQNEAMKSAIEEWHLLAAAPLLAALGATVGERRRERRRNGSPVGLSFRGARAFGERCRRVWRRGESFIACSWASFKDLYPHGPIRQDSRCGRFSFCTRRPRVMWRFRPRWTVF